MTTIVKAHSINVGDLIWNHQVKAVHLDPATHGDVLIFKFTDGTEARYQRDANVEVITPNSPNISTNQVPPIWNGPGDRGPEPEVRPTPPQTVEEAPEVPRAGDSASLTANRTTAVNLPEWVVKRIRDTEPRGLLDTDLWIELRKACR